ncbi:MAG TPA: hypothetical protein VHW00_09170 [Thermoanaerobaculia bacterium]|nr:hypothetical protein [Thermoanaerobaculia bacterium]
MRIAARWWVLVFAWTAGLAMRGADPQELVLLPLYLQDAVAGANGSRWTTELVMHNGNGENVFFGPCNVPSETPCPPLVFVMTPGETLRNPVVGFTSAGRYGRLLHVPHDLAANIAFNLRVFDAASTRDAGTEIPVARSGDFVASRLQLLNVPTAPAGRVLLRLYDPDDRGAAARVAIRVYSLAGALLQSDEASFSPSGYGAHEGLRFAPSFIEAPLEIPAAAGNQPVRVEIEPLTDRLRIWGFVTVTNDVTQHVTVISPM